MIRIRTGGPLTASGCYRRVCICLDFRPWRWPETGFRWEEWERVEGMSE